MKEKGPYSKEQSAFKPPKKEVEKKRPKPIAKKSAKRKIADIEYKKLNIQFLTENKICQICKNEKSNQVHHKWSGKDRDKYYLDTNTWLALCTDCHNEIHAKPGEARQKGHLF